jgi:hypothetical protein
LVLAATEEVTVVVDADVDVAVAAKPRYAGNRS